jgi:hypothetical protein
MFSPAAWSVNAHVASCFRYELLIDAEEDRTLRAVLVGMLQEGDQKPRR